MKKEIAQFKDSEWILQHGNSSTIPDNLAFKLWFLWFIFYIKFMEMLKVLKKADRLLNCLEFSKQINR